MSNDGRITIGIDAGPLLGQGGISRYVAPLVRSLITGQSLYDYRLVLRRSWASTDAIERLQRLAPVRPIRTPDRLLSGWWDLMRTPFPLGRKHWNGFDLFLSTCLFPPILTNGNGRRKGNGHGDGKGRVVSIVYDLTPMRLPDLFSEYQEFRSRIERVLERSEAVIAISQRTKDDIVQMLGFDERCISVIHPGCGPEFRPLDPSVVSSVLERYGIRGRYVLYVGAVGPHKNVEGLLRAYKQARTEGEAPERLVLVTLSGWGKTIQQVVESLHLSDQVLPIGRVPEEDLAPLYAGAEVFAFPSLYEGFGLPVLEAMACGAPVIVADRGSLPEVVGDAGLCVDPSVPSAMAKAICMVAGNNETRNRMRAAGLQRASLFRWEDSTERLRALIDELTGRTPSRSPSSGSSQADPYPPTPPDMRGRSLTADGQVAVKET